MRTPPYISPTALDKFYTDREEYYRMYLCDTPLPRLKQTEPMAVGAAFDAMVKGKMIEDTTTRGNEWAALYREQVEEHQREYALQPGIQVMQYYESCGAYAQMLSEVGQEPDFEVSAERTIGGVPMKGKPDVYAVVDGRPIVLDWKVNGYCGKSLLSPNKGYVRMYDKGKIKQHKDCMPDRIGSFEYNTVPFDQADGRNLKWARQLTTYCWLGGAEPGATDCLVGIDQVTCDGRHTPPTLRVAQHRGRITPGFQRDLLTMYQEMWARIQSGEIFDENNQQTIDRLDEEAAYLARPIESAKDAFVHDFLRS